MKRKPDRLKKFWDNRARDLPLDLEYLEGRISKQYGEQKWITFCKTLLTEGFTLSLYEAKKTFSKYITVNDEYRVRFSNHKPNVGREIGNDCDFFVGAVNKGAYQTYEDALKAVREYFNAENCYDRMIKNLPHGIRIDDIKLAVVKG